MKTLMPAERQIYAVVAGAAMAAAIYCISSALLPGTALPLITQVNFTDKVNVQIVEDTTDNAEIEYFLEVKHSPFALVLALLSGATFSYLILYRLKPNHVHNTVSE